MNESDSTLTWTRSVLRCYFDMRDLGENHAGPSGCGSRPESAAWKEGRVAFSACGPHLRLQLQRESAAEKEGSDFGTLREENLFYCYARIATAFDTWRDSGNNRTQNENYIIIGISIVLYIT